MSQGRAPIRLGLSLTPKRLEEQLRGHHPYVRASGLSGWARQDGLRLDLSRLQYADFGALAQLLLLVEAAARHGAHAWIALPLTRLRQGETQYVHSLADNPALQAAANRQVRRHLADRQGTFRWMRKAGFLDAVSCRHVP